jgi:hypothetical protein
MPIPLNLPNFLQAPIQKTDYSGLTNLPMKLLEAYQMPMKMEREKEMFDLKKALQQAEIDYKGSMGKYYEGQAGQPLSPEGKLLQDYNAAMSEKGEQSPQAMALRAALENKARGKGDMVPAQVKGKQMNAMIARDQRNYIAKNLEQPYIGAGSNVKLINDFNRYNATQDPQEKKALAYKLALAVNAKKLLPEYSALQLTSQGQTGTVSAKKAQEKAIQQGWPESLLWFENNMPKEIQELANEIHADSLEKLGKIGVESYERLIGSKGSGMFDGYNQEMVPESSLQLQYNPDEVEYAY